MRTFEALEIAEDSLCILHSRQNKRYLLYVIITLKYLRSIRFDKLSLFLRKDKPYRL